MSDKWFDDMTRGEKYSDTIEIKPAIRDQLNGRIVGTNIVESQLNDAERQAKPKKKNRGKVLEALVKSSAEKQYIDCERLKDAGYTGDNEYGKRFTITNLSDFVLFNGKRQLWLEVKSTGTLFEFDFRQRNAMTRKADKDSSQPLRLQRKQMIGLLIEFKRNGEPFEVWYVDIDDLNLMDRAIDKKSFNTKDLYRFYIEAETCNTYQVRMYKPARARKMYIDIAGMMGGNTINPDTVRLEAVAE